MLGSFAARIAVGSRWNYPPVSLRAVALYAALWLGSWKAAQAGEVIHFVSIWYVPAGISFAFLLLFGPRFLPFVLGIELAASLAVHSSIPELWIIAPLIVSAGYGTAALVVHSWGRPDLQLTAVRDVGWVIGGGGIAAVAVAILGSWLYASAGLVAPGSYGLSVVTWWLGDLLGILIATPVLLQIGAGHLRARAVARTAGAGRLSAAQIREPLWRSWRIFLTRRSATPLWLGYAAALVMPLLFVILRVPFEPFLGVAPFLLLFPAISIAAFIGGLGPGLVSVGVSSGIAAALYLERQGGGFVLTPQSAMLLVFFVLVAALQVFILDRLHDWMRRAERARVREHLLRREVQHRAANIMQIAIAMVQLQARSEGDAGRQVLANVMQRLQTLADTQRRLSGAPISADPAILEEIAEDVLRSIAGERIGCLIRIDHHLSLGPEQLQCLGLIVGELITNSVKHAFAADEEGRIEIALTSVVQGMAELEYSDSGKPFAASSADSGSGMQLIAALAAQLSGSVSRTNEPGKRIAIRFPVSTAQ